MSSKSQKLRGRKRGKKGAADIPDMVAELKHLRTQVAQLSRENAEKDECLEQYEHLLGGRELPASGLARRIFSRHLTSAERTTFRCLCLPA